MTREDAINHLKTVAKSAIDSGYDSAVVDAVGMAREALEQEPCGKDINVPATDAISRQAVLNILDDMVKDYINENDFDKAQGVAWVKVQKLPPVTPQPKTGHWIPVSERLPEKHSYTLWCASSGRVRSDYFNGEFWEDAERYCYEVIAWMPLPEPYKSESEEENATCD